MTRCGYCNSVVLFGGSKTDEHTFCNDECLEQGVYLSTLKQIPKSELDAYVKEVHQGVCPECQGNGPVDLHTSYRIWSILIMSTWTSRPHISCRSCGMKEIIKDSFISILFGWWGFPWGILMTPVQFVKNIVALVNAPAPTRPSEGFTKIVGLDLAARIVHDQLQNQE